MRPLPLTFTATLLATAPLAAQSHAPPSPEVQIALAVQAAPADRRDGATVQGYDADGRFIVLREGTNDLVCMAPNPASEEFEVSCHHEGLEPYFARGRELRAAGHGSQAATQMRWEEVEAGTLPLPYGTVNYILHGSGYDPDTATVLTPFLRWVIYTPNATPEDTGLTAQATEGAPWLMFPGTPGAHIMIVPPTGGGG
jgi:hypothetical protein